MDMNRRPLRLWVIAAVLSHLLVAGAHGAAHAGAHVPLSRTADLFVMVVILAGPLVGLALLPFAEPIGMWVIALTLAGSLVFGFVNHFVFVSPDHVSHIAQQWRPLFATTAVLLVVTEALGSGLAIRLARRRRPVS
jgi:hypothetical protein